MVLPANWITGDSFTATAEDNVEAAINDLASGATVIPRYVTISSAATLTLTVARNVYVFSGTTSTWTLPAVSAGTYRLFLYNRGSGLLTVQRAGANQILVNGAAVNSFTIAAGKSAQLICDGTYWLLLSAAVRIPRYDNSTMTAKGNGVTGFSFSHTVGAGGPCGVVVLLGSSNPAYGMRATAAITAGTFGGISLVEKASGYMENQPNVADSWFRIFAANGIPSGAQTVNLQFSQGGKNFDGFCIASTYFNVSTIGTHWWSAPEGVQRPHWVDVTPDTADPSILSCWYLNDDLSGNTTFFHTLGFTERHRHVSTSDPSTGPWSCAGELAVAQTATVRISAENQTITGDPTTGMIGALSLY